MKPLILIICTVLLFAGCAKPVHLSKTSAIDPGKIKNLARQLDTSLRKPALKNRESGVMTIVNLNDLEKADIIGRYVQEHLTSELYRLGFRVVEIRQGKNPRYEKKKGETILTRDETALNKEVYPTLKSLFTGTYVDTGSHIYIAAKMIELDTGVVRASGHIKLRKTKELSYMTGIKVEKETKFSDIEVYERFPLPNE